MQRIVASEAIPVLTRQRAIKQGACHDKLINLAHARARSQDSLVRAWSDPVRNSDRPDN